MGDKKTILDGPMMSRNLVYLLRFSNSAASASGDLSKTTTSELDKLFNIYECFVTSSLQVLDWSCYFSRVSERFFFLIARVIIV